MRAATLAASLAMTAGALGQDGITIGGFDLARGGGMSITDGDLIVELRDAILDTFDGVELVSAPTMTPEFLSEIDVLVVCSLDSVNTGITPLSNNERAAILAFIETGSGAFILTDGDGADSVKVANESLLSLFAMHSVGSINLDVEAVEHPIWNGPHGEADGFMLLNGAYFDDLGPHANSLAADAEGRVGLAVIEREATGPESGSLVLTSDTSAFFNQFLSPDSETFALNVISYVGPGCQSEADLNGDGVLDILDFLMFQIAFLMDEPEADCNGDGQLNVLDFVCFQNLFKMGCQ